MLRRPVARRAGWGMLDQAITSLINFSIGILVARSTDARGLGVFGILFAGYVLAQGVGRALLAEPYMIRVARSSPGDEPAAGLRVVGGASIVLAAVAVVVVLAASMTVSADVAISLRAFALALPGLLLQDALRFVFLAHRRPRRAAGMDANWLGAVAAGCALLALTRSATLTSLVLVWGGGAAVAATVALIVERARPAPGPGLRWTASNRDLGLPFLGELTALQGAGQATVYGIPAVAGLSSLGALKGAELALGPVNILSTGLMTVAMPELVRLRQRSLVELGRVLRLIGAVMALVTLGWGLVLLADPLDLGSHLLGESWEEVRPILVPVVLLRMAAELAQPAGRGLRVLERATTSLRVQVAFLPFYVTAVLVGAARAGALGAAVGGAVVACVSVVVWWHQLARAMAGADEGYVPAPVTRDSSDS
jgi:O-antigen/teichoic acid export membrane protein